MMIIPNGWGCTDSQFGLLHNIAISNFFASKYSPWKWSQKTVRDTIEPMLGQRRIRWTNLTPTWVQYPVFSGDVSNGGDTWICFMSYT